MSVIAKGSMRRFGALVGLLVGGCGVSAAGCGGGLTVADEPADGAVDDGSADGIGSGDSGADAATSDDSSVASDAGDDTALSGDTGAADTASGGDSTTTADGAGGDTGTPADSGSSDTGGAGDTGSGDTGGAGDTGADAGADVGSDMGVVCPAPTAGSLYVSPTGSDTTGNGSQACPFVTITKALSLTVGSVTPTTINVASGSAATPNVYGNGCTAGAGKCDATPIRITDGMKGGIVIQGSSADPNALRVVGGSAATDTAVLSVSPANVGFRNLTVVPTKVATNPSGGRVPGAAGILFAAPPVASGAEASVTNVIVAGVIHSSTTESTGPGISIAGGTSPTIGPAVTIVGGDQSVLVTQSNVGAPMVASHPTITSSAAGPSFFHDGQFACVRIESVNAAATATPSATLTATTAADPGRLHLQDCGGSGGVVVVDVVKNVGPAVAVGLNFTLIDTTGPTAAAYYGVRLLHFARLTATNAVTISGINELAAGTKGASAAVEVADNGAFGTSIPIGGGPGVVITRNNTTGLHVTGFGVSDLNGLTSTSNGIKGTHHGLLCDAGIGSASSINVFLRNSTFLGNFGHGVAIGVAVAPASVGCVADMGNANAGNNVFNKSNLPNKRLGLCYTSQALTKVGGNTWSCGLASGAACTPAAAAAPAPVVVNGCDLVGDYNNQASFGATIALPQTCCGM
jgi:hypothetical protein